jgi:hypothetical protein
VNKTKVGWCCLARRGNRFRLAIAECARCDQGARNDSAKTCTLSGSWWNRTAFSSVSKPHQRPRDRGQACSRRNKKGRLIPSPPQALTPPWLGVAEAMWKRRAVMGGNVGVSVISSLKANCGRHRRGGDRCIKQIATLDRQRIRVTFERRFAARRMRRITCEVTAPAGGPQPWRRDRKLFCKARCREFASRRGWPNLRAAFTFGGSEAFKVLVGGPIRSDRTATRARRSEKDTCSRRVG